MNPYIIERNFLEYKVSVYPLDQSIDYVIQIFFNLTIFLFALIYCEVLFFSS